MPFTNNQNTIQSLEILLMPSPAPRLRCREILTDDLGGLIELLHRGFPEQQCEHWARALKRLEAHATPAGYPKFGYLLESDGKLVGTILVIFSSRYVNGEQRIRGNVASWYVEPAFRGYAALLTQHALAHKNATFLNISPAQNTWPILKAQGFVQFATGQFKALAALGSTPRGSRVSPVSPDIQPDQDLSAAEITLLLDHMNYGCISVTCNVANRRLPFIFSRRWHAWKSAYVPFSISLPYALLVYCRDITDFVQFAAPLGQFLIRRGMPMVFIDSNGPIPGLVGKFSVTGPKFYRGPQAPTLGDVSYTEWVMFCT